MAQPNTFRTCVAKAAQWGFWLLWLLPSGIQACDFTTVQDLQLTVSGTHNNSPGYTQVYALTDPSGHIVAVSNQPNFGPMPYGQYQAHAINYEQANPPATLPAPGIPLNNITGGCTDIFTRPGYLTVCEPSILQACENSGQVIRIVTTPDYNQQPTFHQTVVIVNAVNNLIVAIRSVSTTGTAIFTTTTSTGDLQAGNYYAYAVNYEDPNTPATLGLTVGQPWPANFGAACAVATTPASVAVDPPGACAGGASNLTACENSGDVIVVHTTAYQTAVGYSQMVVIVDRNTGLVVANAATDAAGFAVFSTITGVGDLQAGNYWAYALNIQAPASLSALNLTPGNTWPGNWGTACADTSNRAPVTVTTPGTCVFPLPFHNIQLAGESQSQGHDLVWTTLGGAEGTAQTLERITAQNHTQELHHYTQPKQEIHYHAAHPPGGESIYRVRCTHPDGQIHYSNHLALQAQPSAHFTLYPNPSQGGDLNLQWAGLTYGALRISLYDVLGRQIWQNQYHDLAEQGQMPLSLPVQLSPGSYWVQLQQSNGHQQAIRWMVVK